MTAKPDFISNLLLDLHRGLNATLSQHGRISLDPTTSKVLVVNIAMMAECTRAMEATWSDAERSRKEFDERMKLFAEMAKVTSDVLRLMRPDTTGDGNIVQFRPKPSTTTPAAPSGGDAA